MTGKLNRRSLLAGIGAIGAGAAFGGAGTLALFNDTEAFTANRLEAGELDLMVDWREFYNGELLEAHPEGGVVPREELDSEAAFRAQFADVPDALLDRDPVVSLDDVKPGDSGSLRLSLHLFDNPAWVWMRVRVRDMDDNGVNEPEGDAGDTTGGDDEGELQEYLRMHMFYDEARDGRWNPNKNDPYDPADYGDTNVFGTWIARVVNKNAPGQGCSSTATGRPTPRALSRSSRRPRTGSR
ncbi:SipW-dependent-type signal peptide-containing protein [Halobacteriaceae archaeon GCM10025711]